MKLPVLTPETMSLKGEKLLNKIREDFIDFFLDKEHKFVRSSPVFSLDDPSLLFINADGTSDGFLSITRR